MNKSWTDMLPSLSTKQLIGLSAIVVSVAIYMTSQSPAMWLIGGFGALTLFASKGDTDNLTMREIIDQAQEDVKDRQNRHELPMGDIELQEDDVGMQYICFVEDKKMKPYCWWIGYKIRSDRTHPYVMQIGIKGFVMSNRTVEKGWNIADIPEIITVESKSAKPIEVDKRE